MDKKIVIKIGSSIFAPKGKIDNKVINNIVKNIVALEEKGKKIVLVSSGAIVSGIIALGHKKRLGDIHSLQAYASLGQVILMNLYAQKFKAYKKMCAQVLLTWDDFEDRERYLNARYTIEKLLKLGIIPIINENDTVSNEEIKFGDNDKLSALVSNLISAQLLLILSDVEGLLREDELVRLVDKIDDKIMNLAKREDSIFTTGGMVTKLEAARIATKAGVKVVIADGRMKNVISKVMQGRGVGSLFLPHKTPQKAKKRWIAFSKKVKGKIFLDDGAKEAVLNKGKSILSCGITKVEGYFFKKDAVEVLDVAGNVLGCGLVEYGSLELIGVKNKRFKREILHRDNFVKKEA